jgi:hypothetical protein
MASSIPDDWSDEKLSAPSHRTIFVNALSVGRISADMSVLPLRDNHELNPYD